jgi:anti-sigma B factor antagonist
VTVEGECDLYAAPAFAKAVLDGISDGWRAICLECTGLTYLDSTGVGALIRILQALARAGGTMTCTGLHGAPRKVLEMSNILPLLREEKEGT